MDLSGRAVCADIKQENCLQMSWSGSNQVLRAQEAVVDYRESDRHEERHDQEPNDSPRKVNYMKDGCSCHFT